MLILSKAQELHQLTIRLLNLGSLCSSKEENNQEKSKFRLCEQYEENLFSRVIG